MALCYEFLDEVATSPVQLTGETFHVNPRRFKLVKSVKSTESSLLNTFNSLVKKFSIKFDDEEIKSELYQNLKDVLSYNVEVHENDDEIVSILSIREFESGSFFFVADTISRKGNCPRIALHFNKNTKLFSFCIEFQYHEESDTTVLVSTNYESMLYTFSHNFNDPKILFSHNKITKSTISKYFVESWHNIKKNFILNIMKNNAIKFSLSYMNEDALYLGRSTLDRSLELYNMLTEFHPYTIQFAKKYKFSITSHNHHREQGAHGMHPLWEVNNLITYNQNIKVDDDYFLNIILSTTNVKYPKYIKKYLSTLPSRFRLNTGDIRDIINAFRVPNTFNKKEILPLTQKEVDTYKSIDAIMRHVNRRMTVSNISLSNIDNIKLFTKKYFDKYDLKNNYRHVRDYVNFMEDQVRAAKLSEENPYPDNYIIHRTPLSILKSSIYYHENINRISLLTNNLLTERYGIDATNWNEIIPSYVTDSGVSIKNITDSIGLNIEGSEMSHCVGGYTHSATTGQSFLFSLRDVENPSLRSTVEIKYSKQKSEFYINQNYSVNNKKPAESLIIAGNSLVSKLNTLFPTYDSYYELTEKYVSDEVYYQSRNRRLTADEVTRVFKEFNGLL